MKALIMAGGQGTRFWPASRRSRPKQFLNILGKRTMLQETMARLEPLLKPSDIYLVCHQDYVEDVQIQAPGLPDDQIIVEPVPRNTAACIGLAAQRLAAEFPDEVMVALPADHSITRVDAFHQALKAAELVAREDWLVTFGIRPTFPSTGYGYVERGEEVGQFGGETAFEVARFVEKPDLTQAEQFVEAGRFDWNSGIFVWKISVILDQIEKLMPQLHASLGEIASKPGNAAAAEESFRGLPSVSIDFGVMEKASRVATIPTDLGWSDVGSWRVLAELLPADEEGHVANSFLVPVDSRRCVVRSTPRKLVALIGVEDLVVVDTADALLICPRERSEEVQQIVSELKARKLDDFL